MAETIFSKIVNKEIPAKVVYEDEKVMAFLDISPFEKGHTLVIPKFPYETIFDMEEDEYLYLTKKVREVAQHLRDKLDCDINIWQNNGELSGQDVAHVHFHVVPRREKKKTYCLENKEEYGDEEMDEYVDSLSF